MDSSESDGSLCDTAKGTQAEDGSSDIVLRDESIDFSDYIEGVETLDGGGGGRRRVCGRLLDNTVDSDADRGGTQEADASLEEEMSSILNVSHEVEVEDDDLTLLDNTRPSEDDDHSERKRTRVDGVEGRISDSLGPHTSQPSIDFDFSSFITSSITSHSDTNASHRTTLHHIGSITSDQDENTPPNFWMDGESLRPNGSADEVFATDHYVPGPPYSEPASCSSSPHERPSHVLQDISENNQLKRKREETNSERTGLSDHDYERERRVEDLAAVARTNIREEIESRLTKWSPENSYFNRGTVKEMADDKLDDAALHDDLTKASHQKPSLQTRNPRSQSLEIIRRTEKRRKLDNDVGLFALCSDEIVLHIFEWLPKLSLARVMRVCRRFRRIACDDTLWTRFDLGDRVVRPGQLGVVLSRGVQALRLMRAEVQAPLFPPEDAFNCGMNKEDFFSLPNSSFKVQHLDLSMIVADSALTHELLQLCGRLTHLSLERCSVPSRTLHLIARMPYLLVLNLSTCNDALGDGHGLTALALAPVLKNCTRLHTLNLAWVGFSKADLHAVILYMRPNLVRLNLSGNRNTLVDEDLQLLADKCFALEVLDISDSHLLSVEAVAILCDSFVHLRHLSISRCYGLQPPSVLLPLASLPFLAKLDVFGIMSGEALKQFSEHFRHEVEMNQCYFSYVARPTPWDPPKLTRSGPQLKEIWGVQTSDDHL